VATLTVLEKEEQGSGIDTYVAAAAAAYFQHRSASAVRQA
jgi:hypothetical protein